MDKYFILVKKDGIDKSLIFYCGEPVVDWRANWMWVNNKDYVPPFYIDGDDERLYFYSPENELQCIVELIKRHSANGTSNLLKIIDEEIENLPIPMRDDFLRYFDLIKNRE